MIIRFVALLAILGAAALAAFAQDVQIRINQAGYQASDIKKAVVFSKEPLSGFVGAEDLTTGKPTPLRLPLRPIPPSPWGGEFNNYYELDFSSLKAPGRYRLRLEASGVDSHEDSPSACIPAITRTSSFSCGSSGAATTRFWTWPVIGETVVHFTARCPTNRLSM